MTWILGLSPVPEADVLVPWLVAADSNLQLPKPKVDMEVTTWVKLTLPSGREAQGPGSITVPGLSIRSLSTSHFWNW